MRSVRAAMSRWPRSLHHRAAHGALRFLGVVVAGFAVLATFAVWRLTREPLSLDTLTPYVTRALAADTRGVGIVVDHTLLAIGERRLELLARGVHITLRDTGGSVTLPEVAIRFSPRALLHGVLAPTRVILDDPILRLERGADGAVRLGLGDATAPGAEDWGARLVQGLAAPQAEGEPLGYLAEVAVRRATLIVDDRLLNTSWKIDQVAIALRRGGDGIVGDISLAAVLGRHETMIDGSFRYRRSDAGLDAVLNVKGLRPAHWAAMAPNLAQLAIFDLPVEGEVTAALDTAHLELRRVAANVALGAGELHHPALPGGALAIAGGELHAVYDPAAGRIEATRLKVDLGGPQVEASGTVDGIGNRLLSGGWPQALTVAAGIEMTRLPVDSFARLWPVSLSPNTRDWVTGHIHDGEVDRLSARLGLAVDLSGSAAMPVTVDRFDGTMAYHNLTVDYFPPLSPARGIDGTSRFDRKQMEFVPTAGSVRRARVTGGDVMLTKLDTNDETAAIDVTLSGPLRDALDVLDSKPLQYPHQIGLDPTHIAGTFDARLKFAFPIIDRLKFPQVDFGVTGRLADLTMRQVAFGRDLSGGALALSLDRSALRLDGNAQLGGVPMTVSWTQALDSAAPDRTHYVVRATLDDAARARLGLDLLTGVVSGPIDLDLDYRHGARKAATAGLVLDLKAATLNLPQLPWTKPPGVPGTAKLRLDFVDDQVTAVRDAVITGAGLEAALSVAFADAAGGLRLEHVDVARLAYGATDVHGRIARRDAGGWRVELAGPSFDATELVAESERTSGDEVGSPLVIDANLDRVIIGKGREAQAVRLALFTDGVHWQAASVDATLPGGGKARVRLGDAAGARSFTASAEDFGAVLRFLDVSDNVRGGQIKISGRVEDEGPRRVLRGKAEGSDYRIVGAPMLARLLSIASFEGIGAMLSGEGIPFTRLAADFTYGDGRIAVEQMRAYGGAIGINVHGTVDYRKSAIDVSGTLVPAYTLNSVLGNIPVLGNLLLGGEGQGVFGANFSVAGSLTEPQISVNPLSALAPGVLRRLFLFDAPGPNSAAAPDASPRAR
jgi:hypothetical protein